MIDHFSFTSPALRETIEVLAYLPPDYPMGGPYRYILSQDGKDYFQLGRIGRALEKLIAENKMEPVLFFGIPYRDRRDRREKYHPDGLKRKAYTQFLAEELVPFVEEHYYLHSDQRSRALAGDSLGATVSLLTAVERPDIFGKLMLHSPFVDDSVLQAAKKFHHWPSLKVYHVIGSKETSVKMTGGKTADFLTPNQSLSAIIGKDQGNYFFDIFPGEHSWKYWQPDLNRALPWLFPAQEY